MLITNLVHQAEVRSNKDKCKDVEKDNDEEKDKEKDEDKGEEKDKEEEKDKGKEKDKDEEKDKDQDQHTDKHRDKCMHAQIQNSRTAMPRTKNTMLHNTTIFLFLWVAIKTKNWTNQQLPLSMPLIKCANA